MQRKRVVLGTIVRDPMPPSRPAAGRKRLGYLFLLFERLLHFLNEVCLFLVRGQPSGHGLFPVERIGLDLGVGIVEHAPDDLHPHVLGGAGARLGRGLRLGGRLLFLFRLFLFGLLALFTLGMLGFLLALGLGLFVAFLLVLVLVALVVGGFGFFRSRRNRSAYPCGLTCLRPIGNSSCGRRVYRKGSHYRCGETPASPVTATSASGTGRTPQPRLAPSGPGQRDTRTATPVPGTTP